MKTTIEQVENGFIVEFPYDTMQVFLTLDDVFTWLLYQVEGRDRKSIKGSSYGHVVIYRGNATGTTL